MTEARALLAALVREGQLPWEEYAPPVYIPPQNMRLRRAFLDALEQARAFLASPPVSGEIEVDELRIHFPVRAYQDQYFCDCGWSKTDCSTDEWWDHVLAAAAQSGEGEG